jgi:2'-5' RNA ligase
MTQIRRQLTLFIEGSNKNIENIRRHFNPVQFDLIAAHVTLCREDEIEQILDIKKRLNSIKLKESLQIEFKEVERFASGKGVVLPGSQLNAEYIELRKAILDQEIFIKEHSPHVTLMDPRNSTCSDEIFEQIQQVELPKV